METNVSLSMEEIERRLNAMRQKEINHELEMCDKRRRFNRRYTYTSLTLLGLWLGALAVTMFTSY